MNVKPEPSFVWKCVHEYFILQHSNWCLSGFRCSTNQRTRANSFCSLVHCSDMAALNNALTHSIHTCSVTHVGSNALWNFTISPRVEELRPEFCCAGNGDVCALHRVESYGCSDVCRMGGWYVIMPRCYAFSIVRLNGISKMESWKIN